MARRAQLQCLGYAVAFNSADSSITTRQLMWSSTIYTGTIAEACLVSRAISAKRHRVSENRPALVFLQSENDSATGQFFPIGQEVINTTNFISLAKSAVPGHHGRRCRKASLHPHPGTQIPCQLPRSSTWRNRAPPGLRATENRASKLISSKPSRFFHFTPASINDGHETHLLSQREYSPGAVHPPTGKEIWRRWKF